MVSELMKLASETFGCLPSDRALIRNMRKIFIMIKKVIRCVYMAGNFFFIQLNMVKVCQKAEFRGF